MSVDEKNENLFFSGEIENDGDVDVTPIAESMKSFGKHTSGTEEMEIYEDTNTDSMEFIHREGNRGVVSDLEFLPEDDDVEGDTRIFSPGDLQSVSDAADAGYAAAGAEAESGVSSGTDIMANEALLSEYGLLTEEPVLDIPEVSKEYVPDEIVMTEEEAEELGDLTYHDEDVSEIRRKEAARRRREEGRSGHEERERHSGEHERRGEREKHSGERERRSGEHERHSGEHERKSGERERRAGEHERHSESRGEHRGEHHKSGSEQRPVHKPQQHTENAGKSAEHHKGNAQHSGQAHKSQHAQSDAGRSANHSAKPSGKSSGSHGERPAQGHGGNGGHGGRPGRKKKKEFSLFDGALIFGAVAAIFLVVILAVVALNKSNNMKKAETVAMLGVKLAALETIGGSGIDDIVANRKTTVIESVTEETVSSGKVGKDVSVNFTSIEKDLKIKFIDKSTNALIKGVAFKVEAKTPSNKQVTWEDSDKDGMIYKEDIESGIYKVKIVSVGDYVFPDEESEVTVKDKISYVAINVVDEIKKENEINLAIEEPKGAEIDTGTQLQDTVAWVGSSQKESYVEINKANDLPNIATLAMASKRSMSCAAPASAEISGDSTVEVGKTITLSAKVKMDDDTEKAPDETTWSSSDSEVATVSGSGVVEGKKAGSVTITCVCAVNVTTGEGEDATTTKVEKTATQTVTVTEATTPQPAGVITGLTLEKEEITMALGSTVTVKATVAADEGVDKTLIWNSLLESVATVDQNGVVTAKSVGTAPITCTTKSKDKDGNTITKTVKVTVTEGSFVKELKLDKTAEVLQINATVKITPTVTVTDDKADKTVTWKSSNEAIATVAADGTVTAKAKGEATITCTTNGKDKDGKALEATCKITVSNAMADTATALKDKSNNQVYVKDGDNYREAKYADYFKYSNFYIKKMIYNGWQTIGGKTFYYKSDGNYVTGEQVIGGVKYNFASDGSLSMGGGTLGIDVSRNNGTINWTAVKNAGVSFVIIRCGYRGYTQGGLIEDSNFHSYASGAEAAGLKVGVYFFSQAVNEREAVEEASMAVSMAKSHRISYPIFIDSEYANGSHTGRADKLSKAQRTAVCKAFCETIRSAGYTPGVYASKYWYYDNLDASALNNYKIWLAHYTTQTDYKGKYELWQKSCTGRINGINGNVDIDTSYLGY